MNSLRKSAKAFYPQAAIVILLPEDRLLEINSYFEKGWRLIDIISKHRVLTGKHYLLVHTDALTEIPQEMLDYLNDAKTRYEQDRINRAGYAALTKFTL